MPFLSEEEERFAVNAGDVLWVYPDPDPLMPFRVRPYRTGLVMLLNCLAATGMTLVVIGVVVLLRANEGPFETTYGAIQLPLFTSACVCIGTVGLVGLADLILKWKGSWTISGPVVDITRSPEAIESGYFPLVEYIGDDGVARKVWGTGHALRPTIGSHLTVHLSGKSPHEAMRSTSTSVMLLILALLIGLFGWMFVAVALGVLII
ncbi:hypothetical protein GCM10022247_35480 [Allokutzneria multivorans]|uniref:Uncharacterized protein n=2 Tax=Allokutzneria multivorans TaxID=1142134 RepID=A0ABP7SDS8_9PSEU